MSAPPIADEVACTCPPTGRRLPHRKTCARFRRGTARDQSVRDRARCQAVDGD